MVDGFILGVPARLFDLLVPALCFSDRELSPDAHGTAMKCSLEQSATHYTGALSGRTRPVASDMHTQYRNRTVVGDLLSNLGLEDYGRCFNTPFYICALRFRA